MLKWITHLKLKYHVQKLGLWRRTIRDVFVKFHHPCCVGSWVGCTLVLFCNWFLQFVPKNKKIKKSPLCYINFPFPFVFIAIYYINIHSLVRVKKIPYYVPYFLLNNISFSRKCLKMQKAFPNICKCNNTHNEDELGNKIRPLGPLTIRTWKLNNITMEILDHN